MASNFLKQRWSIAVVLAILATAALVGSVASRWTHTVLLDTDAWVDVVGPIGTGDAVTTTLTDYASQELIQWVDAEGRLQDLLPPNLAPLASLVAPFVNDLITDETAKFFQSDLYAEAWVRINRTAHAAAVAIVRDQVPFVSTEGGNVTVDLGAVLTPIADRFFGRLSELTDAIPPGLADRVEVDDTIDNIVTTYQNEGLPDRLSSIQVYTSERLAAIQQTVATLDLLVWVLPVLTVLFAAGAWFFAPNRWLMVAILLGAAALGWFLAWLALTTLVNSVVAGIDSSTATIVAEEIFDGITNGLKGLLVVLAIVAGVGAVGVGGWLYYQERHEDQVAVQ